jgi:beta-lactamase regulating signal transducer with metallopeptidase domain
MNTLFEMVLSNALAATVLAMVVAAACLIIRRPAIRNALWLVVLVRLFLPPIWNVPILNRSAEPTSPATQRTALAAPLGNGGGLSLETSPIDGDEVPAAEGYELSSPQVPVARLPASSRASLDDALDPNPSGAPVSDVTQPSSTISAPLSDKSSAFAAAAILWLAGAGFILALAAVRVRRFRRALVDAVRAPAMMQDQAEEVARRLGLKRAPDVWLVPGRVPPLLWMPGWSARSARLILPVELVFHLAEDQRAALLAHELAHLRRGDPWVRWLELLAAALYWWHPLLSWFRRQLRDSEEQCCDAWVVATLPARRAYATALVETVDFLNGPAPLPAPQLASGAGPVRQLQRRVGMIMRGTASGRLTRAGLVAALAFAAAALAFGPSLSSAQPTPREPPRDKRDTPPPRDADGDRSAPEGRPNVNREDIEKARHELERAREEAQRAVERVREAEERLSRLEGRRMNPGNFRPTEPRAEPNDGRFDRPGRPGRAEAPPGFPPGGGFNPGGPDPRFQDLQRQVQELREMMEEIRRELRRGGESGPRPRDARPRGERPGPGVPGDPAPPPVQPPGQSGIPGGPTPPPVTPAPPQPPAAPTA